eukprot:CAMPEP_0178437598 /NCGR_PEP_ID=MMETSP0689_2-20121128/35096_1 /TAXON_ID=160604 /ORGANISM="Amphidinium massartii, Strain CS-259" /LENGTH=101 /DNA_ID=CAMNT_0020059847 /DNA_START=69 /DNA_END=371 /DNA_ORIENTATION=+
MRLLHAQEDGGWPPPASATPCQHDRLRKDSKLPPSCCGDFLLEPYHCQWAGFAEVHHVSELLTNTAIEACVEVIVTITLSSTRLQLRVPEHLIACYKLAEA